jgi:hypothetical protein
VEMNVYDTSFTECRSVVLANCHYIPIFL